MKFKFISYCCSFLFAISSVFAAVSFDNSMHYLANGFGMFTELIANKQIASGMLVIALFCFYYGFWTSLAAKMGGKFKMNKLMLFAFSMMCLVGTFTHAGLRGFMYERPASILIAGLTLFGLSQAFERGWFGSRSSGSMGSGSSDFDFSNIQKNERHNENLDKKKDKIKKKEIKAEKDLEEKDKDEQNRIEDMKKLGITDKKDFEAYKKIEAAMKEAEAILYKKQEMSGELYNKHKMMAEDDPDKPKILMQKEHIEKEINLLEDRVKSYFQEMRLILKKYKENVQKEEEDTQAIIEDAKKEIQDMETEEKDEVIEGHIDKEEGRGAQSEGRSLKLIEEEKADEKKIVAAAEQEEIVLKAELAELDKLDVEISESDKKIEELIKTGDLDGMVAEIYRSSQREEEGEKHLAKAEKIKEEGSNVVSLAEEKEKRLRKHPESLAS